MMNSSLGSPSPIVRPQSSKNSNENLFQENKKNVSRLKRMADLSNQDYAAELLLQMRRIATDELSYSTISSNGSTVHPISPMQRPKDISTMILKRPPCIPLPNSPASPDSLYSFTTRDCYNARFRAVSIGGMNELEETESTMMKISRSAQQGHVSPLQLGFSISSSDRSNHTQVFVTPDVTKKLVFDTKSTTKHPQERYIQMAASNYVTAKNSYEDELDEIDEMTTAPSGSSSSQKVDEDYDDECSMISADMKTTPYPHKWVGETVPPGVALRDVLRKKFSWKSFPELETYLIDHRIQYLECSNAMNYTKAQKQYNNELTQGLLNLAASEGYIFEGFSFAAVRDRIRCFYKSFVQATKKKKRVKAHHHHSKQRGRADTM
jgi:hypothetical protein